jgi:hypothetical protein
MSAILTHPILYTDSTVYDLSCSLVSLSLPICEYLSLLSRTPAHRLGTSTLYI